jgi:hypothetical protein
MLYTTCTSLNVPNTLDLTIGSKYILIKNELWVTKGCHAHSKKNYLNLILWLKDCHQEKIPCTLS